MDNTSKITIYSTQTCGFCHMAKEYFKSLGAKFEEIDVSYDPQKQQEMIQKSGQMGVPVIEINGQIVIGFDKPRIDVLLQKTPIPNEPPN